MTESEPFFKKTFQQINFNKKDELEAVLAEIGNLKSNRTKLLTQIKNLTAQMADD